MEKEIFEILKKYDKQFNQIKDSNFCRLMGTPSLKELDDCYRKIFGKASRLLNGCNGCIMNSLRELSNEYFKQVELETEPETVTDSKSTKKKVGRPKKVTKQDNNNQENK